MGVNPIHAIALSAMLLPASAGTAGAAILAVTDGDVVGLYDAVATAAFGDIIELAAGGLYILDAGSLVIDSTITIDGYGATIDSDGRSRVFYVGDNGNLTLNNLKVTGGAALHFPENTGGGILNHGGTVVLNGESSVYGNIALNGGGIYISIDGTLTLNDRSTVSDNTAEIGGGIASLGTITLNGSSEVNWNTGLSGGGGIASIGTVTLNDTSHVNHNTSQVLGGGILNTDSSVVGNDRATVTLNHNSGVNHNIALDGGGIYNLGGEVMSRIGSSINHNRADRWGGGIYNNVGSGLDGVVTLSDSSSVNHNTAGDTGGGIYNQVGAVLNQYGGSILHNSPNDIAP